jgi:hypothetical protein
VLAVPNSLQSYKVHSVQNACAAATHSKPDLLRVIMHVLRQHAEDVGICAESYVARRQAFRIASGITSV